VTQCWNEAGESCDHAARARPEITASTRANTGLKQTPTQTLARAGMLIIGNNTEHHSSTATALARATEIAMMVSSISDWELLAWCGFEAAAITSLPRVMHGWGGTRWVGRVATPRRWLGIAVARSPVDHPFRLRAYPGRRDCWWAWRFWAA
jgi:hypothetical protein